MNRNLHRIVSYLKWFPKTFHLHGIHSPFIYKLEKEVLRGTSDPEVSQKLYAYRNKLLDNEKVIEVKDLGAGSAVFKSAKRKVKNIAKYAGATYQRVLLLQRLMAYFQPKEVLELGTSLGISTAALAIRNKATVTSIEGCPNTAAIAQRKLDEAGLTNVHLCVGDFKHEIDKLKDKNFDFVYFDGNHSKQATLDYAQQLLPTVHNHTVWIIDDIYWSKEMTAGWNEIKNLPQVSASIDTFWFGMVFFRQEQRKESFEIRL